MNASCVDCISEDVLERYAMGRLPSPECAPIQRHLLHCSPCHINLREIVEYVKVMKEATARIRDRAAGSSGFLRLDRLHQNAAPSQILTIILIGQVQEWRNKKPGLPTTDPVGHNDQSRKCSTSYVIPDQVLG